MTLGQPLGYGVIGNTEVSGTFVLGSSPGTPARVKTASALADAFSIWVTLRSLYAL